ncbi:MAG: PaaI family thioesterase [Rhizobiaceae bacterium]
MNSHSQIIQKGDVARFVNTPMGKWLQLEVTDEPGVMRMRFADRHIGNPFIRALHGGAVGSMIEVSAEIAVAGIVDVGEVVELTSSTIDYIRVTKDSDLYSKVELVRKGRRLAFVTVWCWQDSQDLPVARGSCTLRIFPQGETG